MKQSLLILLLFGLLFSSCKDDNYYEVYSHYDVTPDLKASQMEAMGQLFDNIARNPDFADDQIALAAKSLYSNIEDILPINDIRVETRGIARGAAIGALVSAIARQPEAKDILIDAAERFLGKYSDSMIGEGMNQFCKSGASAQILEAYSRQPDMKNVFDSVLSDFLNIQAE
ncbi:hypothetical protein [Coprobacter sp.]